MKLKLLDLFSGIGGFSLGLESTGFFETIAFVEKDKFCQKVLKKNFNNIPIEEDIRNVKGSNYKADVITGGFPCQPFSIAGKRKGTDDDRYLWDETIRVVKECKPRWFIGENVEGLVNINEGMVLRQVQNDLEREGFEVQCLIIPASGIGAWHQRKRIWIIGCNVSNTNISSETQRGEYENDEKTSSSREHFKGGSNCNGRQGYIQSTWQSKNVPNSSKNRSSTQSIREYRELEKKSKGEEETRNKSAFRTSSSCSDVPNTISERLQGFNCEQKSSEKKQRQFTGKNDEDVWNTESTRQSSNSMGPGKREFGRASSWGKQCKRNWWKAQSKLCGVPNGVSYELDKDRTNRIKSLGNSIVPQIARQLGLAIMETENMRKGAR